MVPQDTPASQAARQTAALKDAPEDSASKVSQEASQEASRSRDAPKAPGARAAAKASASNAPQQASASKAADEPPQSRAAAKASASKAVKQTPAPRAASKASASRAAQRDPASKPPPPSTTTEAGASSFQGGPRRSVRKLNVADDQSRHRARHDDDDQESDEDHGRTSKAKQKKARQQSDGKEVHVDDRGSGKQTAIPVNDSDDASPTPLSKGKKRQVDDDDAEGVGFLPPPSKRAAGNKRSSFSRKVADEDTEEDPMDQEEDPGDFNQPSSSKGTAGDKKRPSHQNPSTPARDRQTSAVHPIEETNTDTDDSANDGNERGCGSEEVRSLRDNCKRRLPKLKKGEKTEWRWPGAIQSYS
ncbi:unnamed protein product [Tilletia controversa]|nr:unnamed protein product [Tilletia controversa]